MLSFIFPGSIVFLITYLLAKYVLPNFLSINSSHYLGDEVFPTNTEFEIIKQSKVRNFFNFWLGSSTAFKSGNDSFDNQFFISSDYKSVSKAIESNSKLQRLIAHILSYKEVNSIVVRDDRLRIKINIQNINDKKENSMYIADLLSTLRDLKKILIIELELHDKVNFYEDTQQAQKNSNFIKKVINIYFALIVSIVFQHLYTTVIYKGTVMLIDNFSLLRIFVWSFIIFIPCIFYIWLKLFGSVRIHLLYGKSLFLFFPTCLLLSYHLLYSTNICFDKSSPEIYQVEHSLKIGGGKTKVYLYSMTGYPLKHSHVTGVRITSQQYYMLKKYNKSEITVKEGWLRVSYIIKVKPIE